MARATMLVACICVVFISIIQAAVAMPSFPLSTSGRHIVDAHGTHVRLNCVNWSGAAQKDGVVGGLQHQSVDAIATLFARQGFNCVRVPFSVWMVHTDRAVYNDTLLHANPSLKGKAQLEILDAVVDGRVNAGLVILKPLSASRWNADGNDGPRLRISRS